MLLLRLCGPSHLSIDGRLEFIALCNHPISISLGTHPGVGAFLCDTSAFAFEVKGMKSSAADRGSISPPVRRHAIC